MVFGSFFSPVYFCIFVFVVSFSADGLHSERLPIFTVMLQSRYGQQFGDLTCKNDIYQSQCKKGGSPSTGVGGYAAVQERGTS